MGIFLMNIEHFAGWSPGLEESTMSSFLDMLMEGKFISIFAMLFGFGFAIQMSRAQSEEAAKRYRRRILGLLAIGFVHATFFFTGDILITYAAGGIVLLAFRKTSTRNTLRWAVAMSALGSAGMLSLGLFSYAGVRSMIAENGMEALMAKAGAEAEVSPYVNGGFFDVAVHRLQNELLPGWLVMPFYLPQIIGLFLFGVWSYRTELLVVTDANSARLKRICAWGVGVGLPIAALAEYAAKTSSVLLINVIGPLTVIMVAPILAMGWAAGIVLLYRAGSLNWIEHSLRSTGQMALTNYLMHSVVFSFLFCGYGLGWYQQVPFAGLVQISLLLWGMQLIVSPIWLGAYRMGPAEWVLRSITYGERQRLVREPESPQAHAQTTAPTLNQI